MNRKMKMEFPDGPYGFMVSYMTWKRYIEKSTGTPEMKKRVVNFIRENVYDDKLLDSFKLGYALGMFSNELPNDELKDFYLTIVLTRDVRNVPIVKKLKYE